MSAGTTDCTQLDGLRSDMYRVVAGDHGQWICLMMFHSFHQFGDTVGIVGHTFEAVADTCGAMVDTPLESATHQKVSSTLSEVSTILSTVRDTSGSVPDIFRAVGDSSETVAGLVEKCKRPRHITPSSAELCPTRSYRLSPNPILSCIP